ncbi:MAG: TonB-dependent receptor [Bacteroidota bacterium]
MRKIFKIIVKFILIALVAAGRLFAQTDCEKKLTGKVLDINTEEPLPFATVKVVGSEYGVVSDSEGNFILTNICADEVDLEAQFLGYKKATHHHDFYKSDNVEMSHTFYLSPEENVLESIVVEGDKIVGDMQSMSVAKIGRSKLETEITGSLASALRNIQGVTFTSAGSNVQLPVIHGLYGNRILIINNGVKHGFQNWGTDHAPEIDITSADNISVLKGAAGVRYGPEALGGVVLVEGNPLKLLQKMYGSVTSGYQTNGRGYHANAQLGEGRKNFSYHFGGNYVKIGDRDARDYALTNTGMEERSANLGFRYHLPKWDFEVYYSYVDQELGLLRQSVAETGELFARYVAAPQPDSLFFRDFSYEIDEPKQNTTHHLAKLEIEWHTDIGDFILLLSQQVNLRKEFDVRRSAELPIIDLQLNTTDTRLEWYHPSLGGLQGTVGLQYFSQNNDNNPGTNTTAFIPNYNTDRVSIYAIENIQTGKNTYEFGLRLDHEFNSARGRERNQNIFTNEFSFTNFTASLGLVRDLSAKWQLRSNLGSAWRTPNMAELYSFGQHGFKVEYGLWRYYANEDGEFRTDRVLTEDDNAGKPERGYKLINELDYLEGERRFTVTAYANYIDNFIFDRPLAVIGFLWGPAPAYIFDQSDALFTGVDLTYSNAITKRVIGTFGASYIWSRNLERSEPLINQPPITVNAELSWETPSFLGLDFSKLTLLTSYTFQQFQAPRTITADQLISGEVEINASSEIFDFKDVPDAYFLGNVRWEWRSGRLGGQFEVRNILNTSYRDYLNEMRLFADDLGRNFLFTLNYKF